MLVQGNQIIFMSNYEDGKKNFHFYLTKDCKQISCNILKS